MNNSIKISLFVCLSAVFACNPQAEETKKEPYEGAIIEVLNMNMLYSDSAKVRIQVKAPQQFEMQNGDRLFPKGVKIDFFDAEGQKTSELSGKKGRFKLETNVYTVTDSVVVRNFQKNEVMTTEELNWKQREEKIFTDKSVNIQTPDELLKGQGLDAKQDFSWYRIRKLTGIFQVDKKQE
jgi:LPS export ABC transporter protein LptC